MKVFLISKQPKWEYKEIFYEKSVAIIFWGGVGAGFLLLKRKPCNSLEVLQTKYKSNNF